MKKIFIYELDGGPVDWTWANDLKEADENIKKEHLLTAEGIKAARVTEVKEAVSRTEVQEMLNRYIAKPLR